jgi:uncharacterized membrane protein
VTLLAVIASKAKQSRLSRPRDPRVWIASLSLAITATEARTTLGYGPLRPRSVPALLGVFTALFVGIGAAHADLRVCNKTKYLINLAVGYSAGSDFATEGWWTVTPGSCATPVRGALTGRYVYLYATDIDAVDVLKGTVSMCIDRSRFKIFGISDCWRRGYQGVNFAEIDTLSASDWTTFLSDPGK